MTKNDEKKNQVSKDLHTFSSHTTAAGVPRYLDRPKSAMITNLNEFKN